MLLEVCKQAKYILNLHAFVQVHTNICFTDVNSGPRSNGSCPLSVARTITLVLITPFSLIWGERRYYRRNKTVAYLLPSTGFDSWQFAAQAEMCRWAEIPIL